MEFKKSNKAINEYNSLTEIKFPNDDLETLISYDYRNWEQENILNIQKIFKNEYNELIKSQNYFYGCSLKTYSNNYEIRLKEFLNNFIDADEIDFIQSELNIGARTMPFHHTFIDNESYQKIDYSLKKRIGFLENKINELGYDLSCDFDTDSGQEIIRLDKFNEGYIEEDSRISNGGENTLNWLGTQTELIELVKSLIANETIKGKQKDIINKFSEFFNIEVKNPNKLINDIKNTRNNGSETIFLNKLKSSLLTFIKRENKR